LEGANRPAAPKTSHSAFPGIAGREEEMFGLITEKRFDELKKERDELFARIENCKKIEENSKSINETFDQLRATIRDLESKIRKQNKADLFFVSAKIQKQLLEGKKEEELRTLINQQAFYQQELQRQQQNIYPGYLGAIASAMQQSYWGR